MLLGEVAVLRRANGLTEGVTSERTPKRKTGRSHINICRKKQTEGTGLAGLGNSKEARGSDGRSGTGRVRAGRARGAGQIVEGLGGRW